MRTDELERVLSSALHDADRVPVDLGPGRKVLTRRLQEQRHAVGRWSVMGVAASVLAVVVTISMVVAGLSDEEERLPAGPSPEVTLSPSGLPIGLLVAEVDRAGSQVVSTVRMLVRPDGTGTYNNGTPAGIDRSTNDYDVEFVKDGPGRAVMRDAGSAGSCISSDVLYLDFTVRAATVVIEDARTLSGGCVLSYGLGSDLVGATFRIDPLPAEISPSGLPVGLLDGEVERADQGPFDGNSTGVVPFAMLVNRDGTGRLRYGAPCPKGCNVWTDVTVTRAAPSHAAIHYDSPTCPGKDIVAALDFELRGDNVLIRGVETTGCLITKALAADLPGTELEILPLPTPN